MSIKGMERHPTAPAWKTNDETSVDLRKRNVIAAYLLKYTATVDVTGGTGAGSIPDDSVFRFLRRIALNAADFDFMSFTGRFLYLYHLVMGRQLWPQTPVGSVVAASSHDIAANILIPGFMLHSYSPDEFGIPTTLLDSPRLVLNTGTAEDFATGNDGALSFDGDGEFELTEIPYIELQERGINPADFLGVRIKTVTREISQAGEINVDLSHLGRGHDLRAVFIQALDTGAGTKYEPTDALIERVRGPIMGGRPKFERNPWSDYQNKNVADYGLDAVIDGAVILDSAEDKRTDPGEMWKVPNVPETPYVTLETAAPVGTAEVAVTTISVARPQRPQPRGRR